MNGENESLTEVSAGSVSDPQINLRAALESALDTSKILSVFNTLFEIITDQQKKIDELQEINGIKDGNSITRRVEKIEEKLDGKRNSRL